MIGGVALYGVVAGLVAWQLVGRQRQALQQRGATMKTATSGRIVVAALVCGASFAYAQNVKIITQDGQVTLRGPVKTGDEKKRIEEIARSVAGESKVDSQLEIE